MKRPMQTARDHDAEFDDDAGRRYAYDFDHIMRGYMMRTLRPWFRGGPALEVGCYDGASTALLAAEFADLTVVEASAALIERARGRVPPEVRFVHGLVEQVQLEARYRAIFLVHTLEHIDPPGPALAALRGALAPDGLLFVVVPNADAASRQIAVKMGLIAHNAAVTEPERRHGHRCTYRFDTLERELRDAGFGIAARGGIVFKPLANFQFDRLLADGILGLDYIEGCYALGQQYPELCASIHAVCTRDPS
jgi:2-polyprenyl-3-methyl-5-hydroxy-6-metoxy-1,4-benzoquinol methylase